MFCEDAHSRWVVGTVSEVQGPHLWHQAQEAAANSLLGLRRPGGVTQRHHQTGRNQQGADVPGSFPLPRLHTFLALLTPLQAEGLTNLCSAS